MIDPRLMVPLNWMPGPMPTGTPLEWCHGRYLLLCGEQLGDEDPDVRIVEPPAGDSFPVAASSCFVLLEPPPLRSDDWPGSIDGADAAAVVLARALWGARSGSISWFVRRNVLVLRMHSKDGGLVARRRWKVEVDANEPYMERIALAELLRTQAWRE